MYRVCFYLKHDNQIVSNTSQEFASYEKANYYLDKMFTLRNYSGGHIEEMIRGIGWCICTE
jgi:hypothetical protein